jgi:hypothetical protein
VSVVHLNAAQIALHKRGPSLGALMSADPGIQVSVWQVEVVDEKIPAAEEVVVVAHRRSSHHAEVSS